MSNNQRLKELSELIKQKGSLTVKEVMEHFQVSDMTVRRDLKKLENEGFFERFHGGIRYLGEEPLEKRELQQINEKRELAKYCISIIEPDDTVILDAGSTTYQIAVALAESNKTNITVITNSLKIAYRLQKIEGITLIMCGGELRQPSGAFIGSVARKFFENIFAKKAFISTGGITNNGFSTINLSEAEIKQTMTYSSESTFIVADHTKFGYQSLYVFAPLESAQSIISTKSIPENWKNIIQKRNINLKLV